MYFERFYDLGLAHASYLVGCQKTGEAIVIDASRHTQTYHQAAQAQGLRIVAVTETHIHADYLSGSRQLAQETGAKMFLSGEGGADWTYQFARPEDVFVHDGDIIPIGNLTLKVLHTPGHTPEHISFLLTDPPASQVPVGAFTGDFIFVGDVGRPDLLERAAGFRDTMKKGAQQLYRSLQKFASLPDSIQIWPAHGSGSACGKALGAMPQTVLGYEKTSNWALQVTSEEDFVEKVLEGQPEPPFYFAMMKKLNKEGPPLLDGSMPPQGQAEKLGSGLPWLVDLRGAEAFAEGHLAGSLFLPNGTALVTWAGWLLPYDQPFSLLLRDSDQTQEAVRSLRSIGLDAIEWIFTEEQLNDLDVLRVTSQRLRPEEVDLERESLIDVRSLSEREAGHLPGARHIFLGYLANHLEDLPERPVLHCRSGLRSLIASSLLERAGKSPRDILGGYEALQSLQLQSL